jgi:16S rRNA C967 or C1407 C5-methylase (RsmB/RsmF family)
MAQLMGNDGVLVALEQKSHRLLSLRNNLERCGVANTIVCHLDAAKAAKLGLQFDKVLLDAPCSGNYADDPDWFGKRTLQGIRQNAAVQRKLLAAALAVLKPKGTLVYATCSLEPEENELNMQWLFETFGVHFERISIPIGEPGLTEIFGQRLSGGIANTRRFWPHKTGTEGFYIAKVRKR